MATDPSGTVSQADPKPTVPNPSAASGSPPSSRRWPIVVGVIILLAIVLVGLGFANVIPGFHLSGSPAPKASTTPTKFAVTIHQAGLPSATTWSFNLASTTQDSTGATITFSEPNGTYSYSVGNVPGFTPDKSQGSVAVAGRSVGLTVTFTTTPTGNSPAYPVTFEENGLPSGTGWSISYNGSQLTSAGASISTQSVNGSYAYTVTAVPGYTASPSSGTATVHGAAVSYPIAFSAIPPPSYPVTFTETGLPAGASWSVTLLGSLQSSAGSTIAFTESNGSYPYTVSGPSGYLPDPSTGTARVNGHPVSIPVSFSAVTSSSSSYFDVTFHQTGLASNITWGPQEYLSAAGAYPVFGTTGEGSTIIQSLPNGTYYWSMASISVTNGTVYNPNPASGSLSVAGLPISVPILFQPASNGSTNNSSTNYTVKVYETGLPAATTWIAFAGSSAGIGTAGSPINLSLPNGTYSVNAFAAASGYQLVSYPTFTVAGAPVSVTVHFVVAYSVVFQVTGISNNSFWLANLNGTGILGVTSESTTGATSLYFTVVNGTFNYSVAAFAYRATPASGNFTISGSGRNISIAFSALPTYSATFTELGLPAGTGWSANAVKNGATDGVIFGGAPLDEASGGTNGSSFALALPDGNYSWMSGTNVTPEYWAAPATGSFEIDGTGTTVNLSFVDNPGDIPVLVEEVDYFDTGSGGLPNGTTWGITIGNSTVTTTGMFLFLLEPNGTYPFTLDVPAGYWALPGGGTFTLEYDLNGTTGAPNLNVAFFPGTPPSALKAAPATAGSIPAPELFTGGTPLGTVLLRAVGRW